MPILSLHNVAVKWYRVARSTRAIMARDVCKCQKITHIFVTLCSKKQQKAATTTTSNVLHPSDDVSHFTGCQRKRIRSIRVTAFSFSLIRHDDNIERSGGKLQDKIPFAQCNVISFVVFVPTWWNFPNWISLSFRLSAVLTTTTNSRTTRREKKRTHTFQNVPYSAFNLKAKWSVV